MTALRMVARLGGSVAGAACGVVLGEAHVSDVVVGLDGPVFSTDPGEVVGSGVGRGEGGHGVDGFAGGLPGGGVAAAAGDPDRLLGVRQGQVGDVGGLEGAGLLAAVAGLAGDGAGGDLGPGQGLEPGIQQRLVALHHGQIVGALGGHEPVQVGAHGVQRVEGHHLPGQLQWGQQLLEVGRFVVLDADLDLVKELPVVAAHPEQVHPGPVRAPRPRGWSCRPRRGRPAETVPPPCPGPPPAGPGSRARRNWPSLAGGGADLGAGRAAPGPAPARVQAVQHDPDRLLIRRPVPACEGVERRPQPGQIRLAGPLDPLPDRGQPVMPGRGERAHRHRDQTRQRIHPALRRPRVRQGLQPLPGPRRQPHAIDTGLDHARTHARQ